jgi:hypothetical protein
MIPTPTQAAEARRAEIAERVQIERPGFIKSDGIPLASRYAVAIADREWLLSELSRLTDALTAREEVGWEHWHKLVDAIPDYEWPSPNIYGEWKKSEKVSFVERVVRDHLVALASRPGVEKE